MEEEHPITKDVWIGKRPVDSIGLNYSFKIPLFDFSHHVCLIDGTIVHLQTHDGTPGGRVVI